MDGAALAERVNLMGPVLRRRFKARVVKIGLDLGLGCPNRGGGGTGCLFCPPYGSGRGEKLPVGEQLKNGLARIKKTADRTGRPAPKALAYFQAYTSTNAPASELRPVFMSAAGTPGVSGLIISTRCDCLNGSHWDLLSELADARPFWLELGLQSAHDGTLRRINRGHDVACFDEAVNKAHERGIQVVAHVIMGLPGEDASHTSATARHLADLGVWGVKMHHLMVLEGTRLAEDYQNGAFTPWKLNQWASAAADFLSQLPPEMVVHRLAADPGPDRLLGPSWAGDKDRILSALLAEMRRRDIRQGGARS